jgi:uncharacterized membrane protein
MKRLILYISILLISVLIGACSESSSKEDNFVQLLMNAQQITEKQAKCLIKKTKRLVEKDEWNKFVEMSLASENGQDNKNDIDMLTLMNVGISMISIAEKCNVTLKHE